MIKKLNLLSLLGVLLVLCIAVPSYAYNPSDVQWALEESANLHIDSALTLGEYRIEAVEFPSPLEAYMPVGRYKVDVEPYDPVTPFVTLKLYKNDQLIEDGITLFGADGNTNVYITEDDELKIRASGFPSPTAKIWVYEYYDPSATVCMQKRGTPEFTITIKTDKDPYNLVSYHQFSVIFKLKNTGDADAKNVKLTLKHDKLPLKRGSLTENYYTLVKDSEVEKEIVLGIPVSLDEKKFNITATATGYDLKAIQYTNTGSKTMTITPPPPVSVEKVLPGSIYLKDRVLLKLKVANTGNYPLNNITLNDSVPDTFKLETDTSLRWIINSLPVRGEWSRIYALRPTTPSSSGHILPAAHATFTLGDKTYDVESNKPDVIVRGPNITLTKTVSKTVINRGETVIVTITAKNIGDLPSRTMITDTLPCDVQLINGELNKTKFLQKEEMFCYNYTIQLNIPGEITLPNATATFIDVVYRGTVKGFTNTIPPIITIIDETASNPAEGTGEVISENESGIQDTDKNIVKQTKEYTQPGFQGILAIIIILIIYSWRRQL